MQQYVPELVVIYQVSHILPGVAYFYSHWHLPIWMWVDIQAAGSLITGESSTTTQHHIFCWSILILSPGALTQAIRNFAKSLESWLTNAMMNIPEEMVRVKVSDRNKVLTFSNE